MDEVSPVGLALLQILHESGPLHVGALAAAAGERLARPLSRGVVSRLMSSMARAGHAEAERRAPSPHGGPGRLAYRLNRSGEHLRERAVERARRDYERLLFPRRLSERAQRLLVDPPEGSAVRAARDYGVDLTLLSTSAVASPEQRFDDALGGMRFLAGVGR
jgi:hypothetical protein